MKSLLRNALLVSMLPAVAWSAGAAAQLRESPQPAQSRPQAPLGDRDGDGSVSAREHAAAAQAMFERMDADRDGHLTAEEIAAAPGGPMSGPGVPPGTRPAQPRAAGSGKAMSQGHGMMGHGTMAHGTMGHAMMMDRDGDGAITSEEHAAMARAMFQRMDSDGDGRVTAAEMSAGHGKMMRGGGMHRGAGPAGAGMMRGGMGMGMSPDQQIELMDLDGDGRISASEYVAATRALFAEADADGDGEISAAERAAQHREMMQQVDPRDEARDGG